MAVEAASTEALSVAAAAATRGSRRRAICGTRQLEVAHACACLGILRRSCVGVTECKEKVTKASRKCLPLIMR